MAVSSTSWKPGEAPPGRPKRTGPTLPLDVRRMKDLAKAEVIKAISEALMMTKDDMRDVMNNNPDASMAQLMVGAVILQCIKEGDVQRFSTLINYVLGRPKPLGSSWHDSLDEDSEAEADAKRALSLVPSSALLEIMRRANDSTSDGSAPVSDT